MRANCNPVADDDLVRRSDPRRCGKRDVVVNPAAASNLDLWMNHHSQGIVFERNVCAHLRFCGQQRLVE